MNGESDRRRKVNEHLEAMAGAATAALQEFSGQPAVWCQLTFSHRAFRLCVGDEVGQRNVLLTFWNCRHVAGPVTWILREPVVHWRLESEQGSASELQCEMRDDPVGFRVSAMTLSWARDESIAGYLGEAFNIEPALK